MEFFKLLLSYCRRHAKLLLLFPLVACIFCIVFALYSVELEAACYAMFLSILLILLFTAYDLIRYAGKHKKLKQLKQSVIIGTDELPKAHDLLEQDYQELIELIHRNKTELIQEADRKQTELMEYLTIWAHQIKTPISAMNLLLQSEQNEPVRQELFKTEQYVEMILQYVRMDVMSGDLMLQNYDLFTIVKQALRKYAKIFIGKRIQLQLEEETVSVLTDEKWLCFVIEQLLSNALKYTMQGSIHIYMEKGKEKTLVIEDTGIGIQAEDLPRIFEKGFTGFNGRLDKKSTGIGLYLCHMIIGKLSHQISISSVSGVGTKVMLDFSRKE